MGKLAHLVCNAFIEAKDKEAKASFLSFLPKKQADLYSSLYLPSLDLKSGFNLTDHLLQSTHYTWFTPFFRTLVENQIKLFLSALPNETAEKLQETLLIQGKLPEISPLAKSFLQNKLKKILLADKPDLLPIEALPESPLNVLLNIQIKELRLLIEFLGLHDLAIEIKQIIDTVKLKKIQSILSKEKAFFLQLLSHKKESVVFKKMQLSNWDGETDLLIKLLQKRGMNRLAKALFPEDPNLVWYIQHQLSNEESLLFSSLHKKLEQPKAYSLLADQIIEILAFFQKHKIQVDP